MKKSFFRSEFMESWFRMSTVDCHVTPTGFIYCFPMSTLQSYCSPDLTRFPFDVQNCSIIFSSFGYMGKHMDLMLGGQPEGGVRLGVSSAALLLFI